MIRDLKPYPAYRDSGVEWLGEVPEDWAVSRLKDAAVVQTGLTLGKSYQGQVTESRPYLRVANVQHGRLDLSEVKHLDVPPHEAAGSTLSAGDVLMTEGGDIDKLGRGCVWRNEIPGCLHQNHVFAVRCRTSALIPQFLALLMVSRHGRVYFELTAKQTTNLASTNSTTLRAFPILLPSHAEQSAIVRFLDRVDRCIRRYIRSKQKLIALLHEQRQAIVHRAVTRGLDPEVRLKPSGVEWLGDVPEHWRVKRLHRSTDPSRPVMYGIVLPGPNVDEGVYIVKGGNCEPGRLRVDLLSRTTFEIEGRYARSRLHRDDIVFAIRGGVGEAELVPAELEGANITQDVARIACGPEINPRWLLHALHAPVFREHVNARIVGATVRGINIRDLKRVAVAVPPPAEQSEIAEYLDQTTAGTDTAAAGASGEISLLREFRTRLIADVVTGKLDVREAAAHLPEETGEPEPLDDTDTLAEDISQETEAPDPDALEEAEA